MANVLCLCFFEQCATDKRIPLDNYNVGADERTNSQLYQNIFDSYSNSIGSKDFDNLLAGVKGNLSYVLCSCLYEAEEIKNELKAQKEVSPELASNIDAAIQDIQRAADASELRYEYFVENWTIMIRNYRKVPSALFSIILPYVKKNLPDTSSKMSGMIFNVCGDITLAIVRSGGLRTGDVGTDS